MRYSFVVADLAGVEQGEVVKTIGGSKRFVPGPLSTMGTAGFTIPLDHDLADFLMAGDALLKVYQEDSRVPTGRRLATVQRLNTAEEAAGGGKASVATTWADPFWTLLRRLIGKSSTGYANGTAAAPVDPADIAADVVALANAEGPSGLAMGTTTPTAPTYVAAWTYKTAAEAIATLAGAALGPTFKVRPQEPDSGVYGLLDFGSIGIAQPDAAFEHGDGLLNVASYSRAVSHEGTANRVFHLPPGFPDNTLGVVFTAQDPASQAARGLLEAVVSADLAVDDLRTKLLAYHIAIRKLAKQTITFQPVSQASRALPILGVDYDTGDVVAFRASRRRRGVLTKRIDAAVRIYQEAIAVSDAGTGTSTLTVTAS